ncbi:hypothetical protein AB0J80_24135 [Actinoplanes sp. NPDC049548]|uniref:hypothetical protein n=1 Tax=Actinoplanes sp. NPDC049548 TaxID=3155152 RepID=UPI003427624A
MRAYRFLGLLIATATALLISPAAAHAEPYPAEPPASSVSEGTVSAGDPITFSGRGFLPGETIAIEVNYGPADSTAAYGTRGSGGFVLASLPRMKDFQVTASEDGTFSTQVQLTRSGTVTLQATGLTSGVTVSEVIQVVAVDDGDNNSGGGGEDQDSDDTTSANGGGGNALPTTGMSGRVLAFALYGGGALLLVGLALVWFARNRRRGLT